MGSNCFISSPHQLQVVCPFTMVVTVASLLLAMFALSGIQVSNGIACYECSNRSEDEGLPLVYDPTCGAEDYNNTDFIYENSTMLSCALSLYKNGEIRRSLSYVDVDGECFGDEDTGITSCVCQNDLCNTGWL